MNGYKTDCYGCTACSIKCPKSAVTMVPDNEGFIYPSIDKSKCINCGLCQTVCPYEKNIEMNNNMSAYAFINSNKEDLHDSSSGGAFIAFAKEIIDSEGVVCGCIFDEKLKAIHCITDNLKIVKRMQGSKYVQSDLGIIFTDVKIELDSGRSLLFVGTPCQVAGLKGFLGKDYPNLITIDLICHGVPSPKLLSQYIDFEKSNGHVITDICFRDKENNGWASSGTLSLISNGKHKIKHISPYNNGYYNLYYLNNEVSRISCYSCKFATSSRVGDITIGDCWNIDALLPNVDYSNGVSVLLINTEKGHDIFNKIKHCNSVYSISISDAIKGNRNLIMPSNMPAKRKDVYERIQKYGLEKVITEDCKFQYVRPLVRKMFPKKLKYKIKSIIVQKGKNKK